MVLFNPSHQYINTYRLFKIRRCADFRCNKTDKRREKNIFTVVTDTPPPWHYASRQWLLRATVCEPYFINDNAL